MTIGANQPIFLYEAAVDGTNIDTCRLRKRRRKRRDFQEEDNDDNDDDDDNGEGNRAVPYKGGNAFARDVQALGCDQSTKVGDADLAGGAGCRIH